MKSKERDALTPLTLRQKAAAFAEETVSKQRESFKRYGVWGDFENPYLTLQPKYEAAQIKVFGDMFLKGHIYRGRKPVNWSPSSRTANGTSAWPMISSDEKASQSYTFSRSTSFSSSERVPRYESGRRASDHRGSSECSTTSVRAVRPK